MIRHSKTSTILLLAFTVLSLALMGCQTAPDSSRVQQVRASAERGDADAQYELGEMYYYGKGVPQNYAEAKKWFEKAAASYR